MYFLGTVSRGGGLVESGWLKLGSLLKSAYTVVYRPMEAPREIFVQLR